MSDSANSASLLTTAPLLNLLLAPPLRHPQVVEPQLPVPGRRVRDLVVVAHENFFANGDVPRGHDTHDEGEPETILRGYLSEVQEMS